MPDMRTALCLSNCTATAAMCKEDQAEGFCAKMAVTLTDEDGKEYQALSDTVFRLAGKLLKGTEPEGSYEEMGAALPLTDAENAAKILLGEAE